MQLKSSIAVTLILTVDSAGGNGELKLSFWVATDSPDANQSGILKMFMSD